jgi:hypothetical protein
MRTPHYEITLRDAEPHQLQALVRAGKPPQQCALRATIILRAQVKSTGSCNLVRQQTRHFCGPEVRWLGLAYALPGRPAGDAYASGESVVVQTHESPSCPSAH